MNNTHTTTVTPAEEETMFGGGTYTITCTCGERITYRGKEFTQVEAMRHREWHYKNAGK
jgi:hypothetical protein